jgi:hypothetical protein
MDLRQRPAQAISGYQGLNHNMLWLWVRSKTRESSGLRIKTPKYFSGFLITAHHRAWDGLGISQKAGISRNATLAENRLGPYSPGESA